MPPHSGGNLKVPRLDLARIAKAHGRDAESEGILRNEVCNRSHDDSPPTDLSDRTLEVLEPRTWGRTRRSAS